MSHTGSSTPAYDWGDANVWHQSATQRRGEHDADENVQSVGENRSMTDRHEM